MSGNSRETLPDVREWWQALTDIQEWSVGPPGCPIVVGRISRMSGRPSRMFSRGRLALPNVRDWSGGPSG